jgi:hypothetical protein
MSTAAIALPRVSTGGPRWDRERVRKLASDWWKDCREILARACPFVPVPSPVRERLALD